MPVLECHLPDTRARDRNRHFRPLPPPALRPRGSQQSGRSSPGRSRSSPALRSPPHAKGRGAIRPSASVTSISIPAGKNPEISRRRPGWPAPVPGKRIHHGDGRSRPASALRSRLLAEARPDYCPLHRPNSMQTELFPPAPRSGSWKDHGAITFPAGYRASQRRFR